MVVLYFSKKNYQVYYTQKCLFGILVNIKVGLLGTLEKPVVKNTSQNM